MCFNAENFSMRFAIGEKTLLFNIFDLLNLIKNSFRALFNVGYSFYIYSYIHTARVAYMFSGQTIVQTSREHGEYVTVALSLSSHTARAEKLESTMNQGTMYIVQCLHKILNFMHCTTFSAHSSNKSRILVKNHEL